jgi:sarcosine oxidase subunit alpha
MRGLIACAIACCRIAGQIGRSRVMAERISELDVTRASDVQIRVDGVAVTAVAGETLAATLLAAGHVAFRRSPRAGEPRGPFCFMGTCQECVVVVDGERRPACQTLVRAGMTVDLAL